MIYSSLILVVSIVYAIIAWRNLNHGIYLLAAGLPTYLLRFSIGPIPMTLLEVLVLIFLVLSLRAERGNLMGLLRRFTPRNDKFIAPICLLLIAATIGVLVAPDKLSALGIWKAYFIEPILVYFIVMSALRSDESNVKTKNLFMAIGAGGLFVAICAVLQKLTGLGIPVPWDVEERVTSVFAYPNAVGLYLGPIIVISTIQFLATFLPTKAFVSVGVASRSDGTSARGGSASGGKVPKKSWLWFLAAIIPFIAIILSLSEAAIVSVIATLFIAALLNNKLRKTAIVTAIAVTILITVSPFRQTVFDKLTLNDYSGQVRRSQWRETLVMLKDHSVFGTGLNGYPTIMEEYHSDRQYEIFQYPHNIIFNIWSELGLLGLIAFVWLAFVTLRSFSLHATSYTLLPFFALLQMTIHGLVDVPYFKNDLAVMTWILLAILAAHAYAKPTQTSS